MSEGYERMKARRAARDASGIAYVDGSIYENMAACVVRSGITLAHVPSYVVAEEIAAALNATPSQRLDAATVEREGVRKAVRDAWFDGRGTRGSQYDSEAVEAKWDRLVDRALAIEPHQHGGKGA